MNVAVPSDVPADPSLAPADGVSAYSARLATSREEIEAAQRLRFGVFNQELNEGLAGSSALGLDIDAFDDVCEHLLVLHRSTAKIVGTYRLQTGLNALLNRGYYSEQEFDFSPYEKLRPKILELGRACIHRDHRNIGALHTLWKGIAQIVQESGARYMMGCSSLNSQDPGLGWAMYRSLSESHLADISLQTRPVPACLLPDAPALSPCPPPPRLLRAYLGLGAKICGPPAIDREFGTIDFLTLLDSETFSSKVRSHFFKPTEPAHLNQK